MTLNKKGNVSMIQAGVLALMLAGFLLIMGLIMLDELYVDTGDTTSEVVNETATTVGNGTTETCANTGACGMNSFTITNMTNSSGGFVVPTTFYEVTNVRTCTWALTALGSANTTVNASTVNMTYTYKSSTSEACLASNETIFGLGKFADYFDLIALAIVITVVISLLSFVLMGKSVK